MQKLTFRVTVEKKLPSHKWYNKGSTLCYSIDGQQNVELVLVRGFRYTFEIDTVGHPFYLTTSSVGGGIDAVTEMVEKAKLSFLVTKEIPSFLYYQCGIHEYMGGMVSIKPHHSIHLVSFVSGLLAPITLKQPVLEKSVYVADQVGVVYRVGMDSGTKKLEVVLDIRSRFKSLNKDYEERGLLDIEFSREYSNGTGSIYIFYSMPKGKITENALSRFVMKDGNVVREDVLFSIEKQFLFHNGGRLVFGRDGYLYVTIGDGGPQKDPEGKAQNLDVLFGKILRLDVSGGSKSGDKSRDKSRDKSGDKSRDKSEDKSGGYDIPKDNPFTSRLHPEIWAYGFRNPWSISFDDRGRCFVADVGLDSVEEIDIVVKGGNYGWNGYEGSKKTEFGKVASGGVIMPIWEYTHEWAHKTKKNDTVPTAVIGGYYIEGYGYVFGDYGGIIMRIDGDGKWQLLESVNIDKNIRAFGRDNNGILYVITGNGLKGGEVYEIAF
jgi:glucose/arabinose dehydrogenase